MSSRQTESDEKATSLVAPPHNLDAERAVLGSMMLENETWFRASQILQADDFYAHGHRAIWLAVKLHADEGREFDPTSVCDVLIQQDEMDLAGGPLYVTQLEGAVLSTKSVERHSIIVLQHSLRREIIRLGHEMAAGEDDTEVLDALARAQARLTEIQMRADQKGERTHMEATQELLQQIEEQHRTDAEVIGVPFGLPNLDAVVGGMRPGHQIVVGALTSVGKTALAITVAMSQAVKAKRRVLCFSLEMSRDEILERMLSMLTGIPLTQIRHPRRLFAGDIEKLSVGSRLLGSAPVTILDVPGISVEQLTAKAMEHKCRHPDLRLIVLDYLQLVETFGGDKSETREREVTKVSSGLKNMAGRVGVPVIALSQLSRQAAIRRGGKDPQLSDMRESGAIEQNADVVILLHPDHTEEVPPDDEPIKAIVKKNRHGATGPVDLTLRRSTTQFMERR
jgi:replicative DNA helicase